MAISFDTSTAYSHASAASKTFSHTVAVDANFLVVCASIQGSVTITGVTYNGVAMINAGVDLLDDRMTIWYLANPATGANDVVVSYSGSDVGNGSAVSFKGVDTSDPIGATTSQDSTSDVTSQSKQITTTTANSWVLDMIWINTSTISGLSADGSQVERSLQTANDSYDAVSTLATTTAGNYNMGWTWTTSARILQGLIEIKAGAVSGTTPTPTLALLGVG